MPTIFVKCNTIGKRLLLPRLFHVNTLSPLGNATVAVKVSKRICTWAGKDGASTGLYLMGTGCELPELYTDHLPYHDQG